ncbi:MAG: hypothetical protein BWY99_01818 [Synergistetes bacterium ADurb.BinA166]|nr:MAG: hypothetical protein BWY99_01818 [Synergistetes bacterium ADurb.BinA166]
MKAHLSGTVEPAVPPSMTPTFRVGGGSIGCLYFMSHSCSISFRACISRTAFSIALTPFHLLPE